MRRKKTKRSCRGGKKQKRKRANVDGGDGGGGARGAGDEGGDTVCALPVRFMNGDWGLGARGGVHYRAANGSRAYICNDTPLSIVREAMRQQKRLAAAAAARVAAASSAAGLSYCGGGAQDGDGDGESGGGIGSSGDAGGHAGGGRGYLEELDDPHDDDDAEWDDVVNNVGRLDVGDGHVIGDEGLTLEEAAGATGARGSKSRTRPPPVFKGFKSRQASTNDYDDDDDYHPKGNRRSSGRSRAGRRILKGSVLGKQGTAEEVKRFGYRLLDTPVYGGANFKTAYWVGPKGGYYRFNLEGRFVHVSFAHRYRPYSTQRHH